MFSVFGRTEDIQQSHRKCPLHLYSPQIPHSYNLCCAVKCILRMYIIYLDGGIFGGTVTQSSSAFGRKFIVFSPGTSKFDQQTIFSAKWLNFANFRGFCSENCVSWRVDYEVQSCLFISDIIHAGQKTLSGQI